MALDEIEIVNRIIEELSVFDTLTSERILYECIKTNRISRYYYRQYHYTQEWRAVLRSGYERYLVSNWGYVRHSSKSEKSLLKPSPKLDYPRVALNIDESRNSQHLVHELVVESFILGCPISKSSNRAENKIVNHIDGDKWNPAVHNLELITQSDNLCHAYASGLREPTILYMEP